MEYKIIYANNKYFKSFHQVLDSVAKERIYLASTAAPALDKTDAFQEQLIKNNWPAYYALNSNDEVVGWLDISSSTNPLLSHRGSLGMGVKKEYRGKGIGTKLLSQGIKHARTTSLEKIELSVYTNNSAAIELYKKFGFQEIGVIKNYRKLDSEYLDSLQMEVFL